MIPPHSESTGGPLLIRGEHGTLQGNLAPVPAALGFVVLAQATVAPDGAGAALAAQLRQAGFSTLHAALIAREEEHFPDVRYNVPMLARRLLAFLDHLRQRMQMGEIAAQPFALCAFDDTTPVAIRVASQRDHDIAAIVCHGGLIDLAGVLYLRTLAAPVLLLHEADDTMRISGNRRALRELRCPHELRILPEPAPQAGIATQETVRWLLAHRAADAGTAAR